ncbi:hypothetical protein DFA_00167 [Cavenderia fasciculata]|uniref:SH3 domain-containing protein n=1 Tax=Cavenderia fasciculata TaxID=261658 RepID=F4PXS9_CACFS|nr:uncharacterized protein DFA_00167 [Cavenderia fasciculata]EGG19589.1 hypothetical protein DFA_00167 [Cavenderia fasciculata]|eukprot:XP_004357883.1 hypothetical protein DFA_00167 [Cavenderia fasciculata]
MITCPECQTEYEKEAKYCFKCRIAFTDDIPDSIAKYLRHRNSSGGYTPFTKSHTTSLSSASGFGQDKPPLNRHTSVPAIKSTGGGSMNNLHGNNIHISTSSPPTNSFSNPSGTPPTNNNNNPNNNPNNNNTTNNNTNNNQNNNTRPRIHSTPAPPSHPLPPTPNKGDRMSVPASMTTTTTATTTITSSTSSSSSNTTSPPIRPPVSTSTPTSSNIGTPTKGGPMRTVSPVNTPPSSADSGSPYTMATNAFDSGVDYSGGGQPQQPQPMKRPLSRRIPPPPPNKRLVRAVWDCISEQEGDLEFYKDEIISVITQDHETGWWLGSVTRNNQTTTGLFPGNYTEPMTGTNSPTQ